MYDDYADMKIWDRIDFGKFDNSEDLFYEFEISRLITDKQPNEITILEIGFGNGSFMGWARDRGYQVHGTELQPSLRERATLEGFAVSEDLSALAEGSIDMVVAFDVFEHIEYLDLVAMCKQIRRKLKPGGYLVARFPNGDSPFSLPTQNADPTHVHSIGRGKVDVLLRSAGFEMVFLRAPTNTPVGWKAKLAHPMKRALRAIFGWYVRAAFLGGSGPTNFELNYLLAARKAVS